MSFASVKIEELRQEGDVTMVDSDATISDAYQVRMCPPSSPSSLGYTNRFFFAYVLNEIDPLGQGYLFGARIRYEAEEIFRII
jgi:hypothetical protein